MTVRQIMFSVSLGPSPAFGPSVIASHTAWSLSRSSIYFLPPHLQRVRHIAMRTCSAFSGYAGRPRHPGAKTLQIVRVSITVPKRKAMTIAAQAHHICSAAIQAVQHITFKHRLTPSAFLALPIPHSVRSCTACLCMLSGYP